MAVYTKAGDNGDTTLRGGVKASKSEEIFKFLGDLDELNAQIGMFIVYLKSWQEKVDSAMYQAKLLDFHMRFLEVIQNVLFDIGSEVAASKSADYEKKNYTHIVSRIERAIDAMEKQLQPLSNFILPGGSVGAAYSHICRTIARRCEREYFSLNTSGNNKTIGVFLNRLSDYFFILARFLNKQSGVKDVKWKSVV